MLATATLPKQYSAWNRRWHAPFGRSVPFGGSLAWSRPVLLYRGPFAFQPNNTTRRFEYPWAHHQVTSRLASGTVLDIGGGMAGMQLVLARQGYTVINVDPGIEAKGRGWTLSMEGHEYICRIFRAPVRLVPTTLEQAGLKSDSVDLILSISTLEHLTSEDLTSTAREIRRILRPGGWVVLTIDLFLGLVPFTQVTRNEWGTNIDVVSFLADAGVDLVEGNPSELCGFPDFDPEAVLRKRDTFFEGDHAVLVQCVVARAKDRPS